MVKAYLRYVQQDVLGGLVGNNANISYCQITDIDGTVKGTYIVSACNEVTNFTNMKTGEVEFKVYADEAVHGYVTCLTTTADLVAIGYSSGTVLVYSLKLEESVQL